MRFALVNSKKVEAESKLKGLCPGCSQPVIAKCGTQKIHHWAHCSKKTCDHWWESETEWHRSWKSHFPAEWQETFLPNKLTGEKHVADVRTSHGLVIEFQHSLIDPLERTTREKFYGNLIWVVDGMRLKRDHPRFVKSKCYFQNAGQGLFVVNSPDECFPSGWLQSLVPVVFDFRGNESIDDFNDTRNDLYCLFPTSIGRAALLAVLSRKAFIDAAINGNLVLWIRQHTEIITQVNVEWQNQMAKQQRLHDSVNFNRLNRYHKRRFRGLR